MSLDAESGCRDPLSTILSPFGRGQEFFRYKHLGQSVPTKPTGDSAPGLSKSVNPCYRGEARREYIL